MAVNMSIVGKPYFYYNTSTKDKQRVNINTLVRNNRKSRKTTV